MRSLIRTTNNPKRRCPADFKSRTLNLNPYMAIYDIVVPKDNQLRQINYLVDFTSVYEEFKNKYCLNTGRNAVSPIRMFKYLCFMTDTCVWIR